MISDLLWAAWHVRCKALSTATLLCLNKGFSCLQEDRQESQPPPKS